MKEFNYEQELAELKEEVQDLLDEIEDLEEEINAKKEQKSREDCANGMKLMSMLFDEAEKAGVSRAEALSMLAIFAPTK